MSKHRIKIVITKGELDFLINSTDIKVSEFANNILTRHNKKKDDRINQLERSKLVKIKNAEKLRLRNEQKVKEDRTRRKVIALQFQERQLNSQTLSEKIFEKLLNDYKIKYELQKIVYRQTTFFILDFYLPEYNLIVEIDGDIHRFQKKKDKNRTEELRKLGFPNLRRIHNNSLKTNGDFEIQTMLKQYRKIKK